MKWVDQPKLPEPYRDEDPLGLYVLYRQVFDPETEYYPAEVVYANRDLAKVVNRAFIEAQISIL